MPRVRSCRSCRYVLYHNTASGSYIYMCVCVCVCVCVIISELTVKQMCNVACRFVWICTLVCHAVGRT